MTLGILIVLFCLGIIVGFLIYRLLRMMKIRRVLVE